MPRKIENKGRRWLNPPEVRFMNAVERAWVGAYIDAEGGVYPVKGRAHTWVVTCYNNNPEIISGLLRATGTGRVYSVAPTKRSQMGFKWLVSARNDVYSIILQCAPYSPKMQAVFAEVERSY